MVKGSGTGTGWYLVSQLVVDIVVRSVAAPCDCYCDWHGWMMNGMEWSSYMLYVCIVAFCINRTYITERDKQTENENEREKSSP